MKTAKKILLEKAKLLMEKASQTRRNVEKNCIVMGATYLMYIDHVCKLRKLKSDLLRENGANKFNVKPEKNLYFIG